MKCCSEIRSPWRMGMTLPCQSRHGHPGAHEFRLIGTRLTDTSRCVQWTVGEDKLTTHRRAALRCGCTGQTYTSAD